MELCIKSDAKNRQYNIKSYCSLKRIVTALMPSLLFRFFSRFLPNLRTLARGKVAKLSSFRDWWAESLYVSIIVTKYNIFPALNMAARAKKKNILAKRFAHAFNVHYRDFEHAYVYWIWLRGSASYVIISNYWMRLSRIWRILQVEASVDNTLRDLQNSSYPTKAEFNNCFIIHSKYYLRSNL